jgi:peptide/nickel transport system substrate-binding protein
MHLKTKHAAAGAMLAGTLLLAAGCAGEPAAETPTRVRIAIGFDSLSFAPRALVRFTGQAVVFDAVYETLIRQTDFDEYEPLLAKSFEFENGRTLISLEVRDDVVFTDGTELTADIVKESFEWDFDLGIRPEYLDDIVVTGEHSLEFHLNRPDTDILFRLSNTAIHTPEAMTDPEARVNDPIGTGPYLLDVENSTIDAGYSFVRNPDYWNPDAYPFDTVAVSLMSDVTARINALKSGQVDVVVGLDGPAATEAEASGLDVLQIPTGFTALSLADLRGELLPPIGDLRVRQAISMAFDRQAIAAATYGGFADANSQIFERDAPGYQEDRADEYAYDPERARELLAEAGYADGFEMRIPTIQDAPDDLQPYIEQALGDIGITVVWEPQPGDVWFQKATQGDYAVVLMNSYSSDSVDLMKSDHYWNYRHNSTPETEDLIDVVNAGTDEEAQEATDRLGQIALDDAWYAVLTHWVTIYGMASGYEVTVPGWPQDIGLPDIHPTTE